MLQRFSNCAIISIRTDTEEIEELCSTLSIKVREKIIQKRKHPHAQTFLGPGKIDEIREKISEVDLIVINGELTPSQHFHLETALKKMCIDRIGLVLEIFDRHAGSAEAKAQIALARIRYELPFLREWVSKALADDRPGFMAGGEYMIDAYYENARRQMKRIEKELNGIARNREMRRSRRKELGFYLVSICGYTNSGKSTLLNSLSNATTLVDDRLFSTLSTATRKMADVQARILLTDTVGFIKNLPPDLVDAFDATMEEIYFSDCVLLVVDFSENMNVVTSKFETSIAFLASKVPRNKIIILLNKIDKLSESELQERLLYFSSHLSGYIYYVISAFTKKGLHEVTDEIVNRMGLIKDRIIRLPNTEKGKAIYQWISEKVVITRSDWRDDIILKLRVTPEEYEIIRKKIASLK